VKTARLVGILLIAASLTACSSLPDFGGSKPANPLLYPLFQDHAVLQRDRPINVWGHTAPSADVTVSVAGETAMAHADAAGHWKASLSPLAAGGPYTLTAQSSAGESETLKDILIGDVFLCSGQSNMELHVYEAAQSYLEISGAANDRIRLLTVERNSSATPRDTFGAPVHWAAVSPTSVRDFSAVCYFFGRELQKSVNVPIGLIHSSWGGSLIESWIDEPLARQLGGYDESLRVLGHYVTSPVAAEAEWRKRMELWWQAHDPATSAAVPWSASEFDDSAWPSMVLTGWWESWGVKDLADFDGIVWFRTTVNLTKAQAEGAATLSLGPVDDIDTTWINGQHIGGLEGWDLPRVYTVPAGTLHEGANVIAVGVLDTGAGGGMYGPAAKKTLKLANGTVIPLDMPWRYQISAPLKQTGGAPHAPWRNESGLTTLYNGMIAPIVPYSLRGALWYQGEANTDNPQDYARLLPGMMAEWRGAFGEPDLPFLIVQLPGFGPASNVPEKSGWAELREVQREVVASDPHTGLAVTIDLGDRNNVHPTNKQDVGIRLSLAARRLIYGETIVASGPTPLSATRDKDKVIVAFDHADKLLTYSADRIIGFELCDAAKLCRFADAIVDGTHAVLDAVHVPAPAFVRFCWSDSPVCNLYNAENLPAVPFELAIR
jgi:sialate O-acetylesterase